MKQLSFVRNTATVVARVYNLSLRNIFNWFGRCRSGGWQALNDKSKQGRPRKVTGDDMEWLYNAITMGNPMNYQFSFCLWSLKVIRGLLEQERDIINSSKSYCISIQARLRLRSGYGHKQ